MNNVQGPGEVDMALYGVGLSSFGSRWVGFNALSSFYQTTLTTRLAALFQVADAAGALEQHAALVVLDSGGGLWFLYDLNTYAPPNPPIIEAEAFATNDLVESDVVGWSTGDALGPHMPTLWTKVQTIRLATLGGNEGEAYDINNKRQVVGWSLDRAGNRRATMWDLAAGSQPQDLGTIGASSGGAAYAINQLGQIAGASDFERDPATGEQRTEAFIFTPGATDGDPTNPQMKALPTGPRDTCVARDINDSGHVVGQISSFGSVGTTPRAGRNPFIWTATGGMQILPTFAGDGDALGINSAGQIVGFAKYPSNGPRVAVVWSGAGAIPLDLNAMIPPQPGWRLTSATDINDIGQIAGHAEGTGASPPTMFAGFLAYPTPRPASSRPSSTWIGDLFQTAISPALVRDTDAARLESGDAILLLFLAEAARMLQSEEIRAKAVSDLLELALTEIGTKISNFARSPAKKIDEHRAPAGRSSQRRATVAERRTGGAS
jgi:probable HAF family extracellular repeat protein